MFTQLNLTFKKTQFLSLSVFLCVRKFIRSNSNNKQYFIHIVGFYGCSFIAKLSRKKNIFEKIFVFFTKYILFAEKLFFYGKKVLYWKFFLLKKLSFTEKNINENVKNMYLIWKIFFIQKMFVLQAKYKSFLNIYYIYSFGKKNVLMIKNIFVKTSQWTQ